MPSPIASLRERLFASISRRAHRIKSEGLTYLGVSRLARIEGELERIHKLQIRGDYLEFGVALGGSALLIAHAAVAVGQRFAGFDVFGMIPAPTSDKDDATSRARYAVIRSGQSRGIGSAPYYGYTPDLRSQVVNTFERYGLRVDGDRIALVQGLFEETWPVQPKGTIAFAHIDCDWYDPVRFCLAAVAEHVQPGGALVLDDYHDYGGCRTAADEFLAAHSHFEKVDGANLILRRRP